jgi:hypothetical protein
MIYKLTFDYGRIDWCTAKNELHLLKSYDARYDLPLQEIESIEEISDALAMTIMVANTEFDETDPEDVETISVYDLAVGDDFCIIASTEFD